MDGMGKDLAAIVGRDMVKTQPEDLHAYASDATNYFAAHDPDAVILPEKTEDVRRVMKYAFEHSIPVTPRGAGSGLSAGATPIKGGIVLDMKRMNKILDINRGNMTARVEPGLVLGQFHRTVEKEKLFYPPDPQSLEVCTLGGNVATRAGGPRGVKYGTTGNYVLGLEVVLPDGELINTGGICVKQSVGYDLTHLLTGSEGTLGVITKINLRLLPLPAAHRTVIVVCETVEHAAKVVSEIIADGTIPARLEFLHKGAIGLMNMYVPNKIPLKGEAFLLIELDGSPAAVEYEAAHLKDFCLELKVVEVQVVQDARDADSYWKARQNLNPILGSLFKRVINEDVTVPRDKIPEMFRLVERISKSMGMNIGMSGHAGDGNIHPVILMPELSEELEKKAAIAVQEIVKAGLSLGGTVSGEHGIGMHKAPFMVWELGQAQMDLMKRVKQAFDPKGIMNPGKIWVETKADA